MSKTHEEYLKQLFDKEIIDIPLEEYINSSTPILHECVNGHVTKRIPNNVLTKSKCQICAGKNKLTTETYIERLKEKEISYRPIEPYINAKRKIKHECVRGHEWSASPDNILSGYGCPKCNSVGGYNKTRFSKDRELANSPGILYCIVLVNKISLQRECVKIGITKGTSNRDVIHRSKGFNGYEPRIQKIYTDTLENVFFLEQKLHDEFGKHRYKDSHKFGGWTELFNIECLKDILNSFPKS